MAKSSKLVLGKLLGVICIIALVLSVIYVPASFGANAVTIKVTEDQTMTFTFEQEEGSVKSQGDDNNLTRGDDGMGCASWGLGIREEAEGKVLGFKHTNSGANWPDQGGYRLNNKDGVYMLDTASTYVVSFKLKVVCTPLNTSSLTSPMTSYLRLGYGFSGATSGNTVNKMHETVSEVFTAVSVPSTDKAKGTFNLTTAAGTSIKTVGDTWCDLTYVFTTPESFGSYSPALGFYAASYYGTHFMVDDVSVTKLGSDKGAVVLIDEYYGTVKAISGKVGEAVELDELTGTDASHEFLGWYKDADRVQVATGLTFAKDTNTVYTKWKAPVTVTFVDTLNNKTYEYTGIAGDAITFPANPVDTVNNPAAKWFMGWYTTESCTEKFTQTQFGYTSYNVYSKWQGEYAEQVEDFENYTCDVRSGYSYDNNRGNIYHNSLYFGTAMQKWDDPTNSGRGKVIAFPWDADMTKTDDPASYDAAKFYKGADNIVQIPNVRLEENVTYTVTFDYYVENMADNQTLTIHPITAHNSGYWSDKIAFMSTQSAYATITAADKDGEWHKGEISFTMKMPSPTSNVIHFMFDLAVNSDTTVYIDNVTFAAVQPYESAIIYVPNNGDPSKVVKGLPGQAIPEYNPQNSGLVFKGWYTDSNFTEKYDAKVFAGGGVTLYAKWAGSVIEFVNKTAGHVSVFSQSMSVVNEKGAGVSDDWAIRWHYDGDAAWELNDGSLMYQRGATFDHIVGLITLEKGETYEIKYWLNVESATNDFTVQFFTTNPGWVWDPMSTYPSSLTTISKDAAGKGWVEYTTMLTVDTDPSKQSGLFISLMAKNRTAADDVVVKFDRISVIPVETGIIFNTGINGREGDWQLGKVGDKINYPTFSTIQTELFDGWFADKECTIPYTYETLQEGATNIYAKWTGTIEEFTNRKKSSTSSFGYAMYVMEQNAGYEDDWSIKWHYDGDAEWSDGTLMYKRGAIYDHVINLQLLEKGTYEISYMVNVEKATNDFAVQFFTTNLGWVYDPAVTYGSSYTTISKDTAGKGWMRYSVMINVDTEKNYVVWEGQQSCNNNGLFMSLSANKRGPSDENIVYIDSVVIKPVTTSSIIFDPNSSSNGYYQKGNAGDAINFPKVPEKVGYNFIGWFSDKACTVPFTEKVLAENTVYTVYAGYKRTSVVKYDFETYNFSNPEGHFVWDEGGEVAAGRAFSGRQSVKINRDLELCHGGRSSFALVGHDNDPFVLDKNSKYVVTFKYYVEKNGEKDAKITFNSGHKTNFWHNNKGVSDSHTISISEKTGVWLTGALVLDPKNIVDKSEALFVSVSGGLNGLYYIDDIVITTLPAGHNAYTVDNGGCASIPMYVTGPIGSSFASKLPKEPKMDNHYFSGYSFYDANGNLSELDEEKMVISKDKMRIIADFVRIETKQNFDDGFAALLGAYGDYSNIDFDYELYDASVEGNSKDNVINGNNSLHRKGTTYHFENAQILSADKSLTVNERYTIEMNVKVGDYLQTDGAIKIGSCATPYFPWSITGDYHSIAAVTDLTDGEWHKISFTFVAVEAFLSIQTPGYCEFFFDDITITRVDSSVSTSKSVTFTEYVPAKRDKDGNLLNAPVWNASVESIIDASLGKGNSGTLLLYVVIGGAVLLAAAAAVVVIIVKKRKKKAN